MKEATLRLEIERHFAHARAGKAYRLGALPEERAGWVVRLTDGSFGVAVPYDGANIFESFAGATLRSISSTELGGALPPVLALLSTANESRNEFSLICTDFVDPGNGERRRDLVSAPREWWARWKDLLGNHAQVKVPHGVLGELLVYSYLLDTGTEAMWSGPDAASHDLHTPAYDVEVKSTTKRYGCVVRIAGQYQMQKQSAQLYLFFCRLEPHPGGISIDDAVEYLTRRHRVDRSELNEKLARLGYHMGSGSRTVTYALQEMRRYDVDDTFPRIVPESFKTGAVPKGITQLSYDADLGDIAYEAVSFNVDAMRR